MPDVATVIFHIFLLCLFISSVMLHRRKIKNEKKKTEKIEQFIETEREKTNKFHVTVEEIRRMTKG